MFRGPGLNTGNRSNRAAAAWHPNCSRLSVINHAKPVKSQDLPATATSISSDETAFVPAEIQGRRTEDGSPVIRLVPIEHAVETDGRPYTPRLSEAELLQGIHQMQQARAGDAAAPGVVQVPDNRLVVDAETLDLIGNGLPIIRGVRRAMQRDMAQGNSIIVIPLSASSGRLSIVVKSL